MAAESQQVGTTRRRVKLYTLNEERQWDDRGTGHVYSTDNESLDGVTLIVKSESDMSILLESKIQTDTAYQKQQETLIVWAETDSHNLALSFQEKAGCDEIWEKICQVQGKDPSVESTQEGDESEDERYEESISDSAPGALSTSPVLLPPCEVSKLPQIADIVQVAITTPVKREQLALEVENEGYIPKLLEVFRMCEDLDNKEGLHKVHDIIKNLILLNRTPLYEVMFSEDNIMDVVGALEYDSNSEQHMQHREFLKDRVQFRQVLPMSNNELLHKIHQTYRVQYVHDVVMPTPSVFDENVLTALNSFLFFNKVDIVTMLQEDDNFLQMLFSQLVEEATDDNRRLELLLFLKELCSFAQTLQPVNRELFFRTLSNVGFLSSLEVILGFEKEQLRQISIDILALAVEYCASAIVEYILKEGQQKSEDDEMLINILIEQIIHDTDSELGLAAQITSILKMLIDPDNAIDTTSSSKCEKNDLIKFFYKHSMHNLTAPLYANTADGKPSRDDYKTAMLLSLILDLITFCLERHSFHIKNYVLNKDLFTRVLILMKSKHSFLALTALRLIRKVVALKDEFYLMCIARTNHLKYVVDAFLLNGPRYNLLNSAIIELFEYIRTEGIKTLVNNIAEVHWPRLEHVKYVTTFRTIRDQYEQHKQLSDDCTSVTATPGSAPLDGVRTRLRRDDRSPDVDEEMWFEQDDESDLSTAVPELLRPEPNRIEQNFTKKSVNDVEDFVAAPRIFTRNSPIQIHLRTPLPLTPSPPPSSPNSSPNTPGEVKGSIKNGQSEVITENTTEAQTSSNTCQQSVIGLVDYPSDEDDDDDSTSDETQSKRIRLENPS